MRLTFRLLRPILDDHILLPHFHAVKGPARGVGGKGGFAFVVFLAVNSAVRGRFAVRFAKGEEAQGVKAPGFHKMLKRMAGVGEEAAWAGRWMRDSAAFR